MSASFHEFDVQLRIAARDAGNFIQHVNRQERIVARTEQ
jgi:hypothetical protein